MLTLKEAEQFSDGEVLKFIRLRQDAINEKQVWEVSPPVLEYLYERETAILKRIARGGEMKPGDKVIYTGASKEQISWGSNDNPREVLKKGEVYTVERVEVHSWHTKIYLSEFPHMKFNSVSFKGEKDEN